PLYRRVVEETLDFVVRELRHEEGGFYSSYDADSEGEEGKFYVWSAEEIHTALGSDAELFMAYYDVSNAGNWEGHNILNIRRDPAEVAAAFGLDATAMEQTLTTARQTLYDIRARRVWPGLDDKVLTAWNGLMLAAFAEAGRALSRLDYTDIATQNAEFLYTNLRQTDGRLLRSWRAGTRARYNAYLEDYAFLADGLLALYQTTFEPRWFLWARELAEWMLTHFQDSAGGFFDTSDDHETLLHRPRDVQDNATPSGNSMAAHVLLALSLYTGEGRYWDTAESMVAALAEPMMRYPGAFSHWLCAAALIMAEPREVAIVGDPAAADTRELLDVLQSRYRPALVAAVGPSEPVVPLLAGRPQLNGRATAYVCRRFVCLNPVTQPEALAEQLL
ncbi:MAG TPA: thioredoxin domain-containing protein, partial [Promineifilum sp.]|nr:thioredoxin domain-containing protein [Promineifilum sp.]